jgi:cell division control protein 45
VIGSEQVRSLILLNLGALVDLALYFTDLSPTVMIHVIDSHRPINLNNLFASSPFASTFFDLRRSAGGRGEHERAAMRMVNEGDKPSVVIWSDAEGDESREGEKEAFEGLQVR